MSILGVSSSSSSAYQKYLESLAGASATAVQNSVGPAGTNCSSETTSTAATTASQGPADSGSAGSTLVQQLDSAVQNALNGASSSQSSSNPQEVLASIEQAIQGVLQGNGGSGSNGQVSQTGHHHHHGGGHGGSGGGLLAALAASDPGTSSDGTTATTSTTTTDDSSTTGQTPTLNSLLSQLNIDPQQFRNDLVSAVSNSHGGSPSSSQVFQSIPSGQALNALA